MKFSNRKIGSYQATLNYAWLIVMRKKGPFFGEQERPLVARKPGGELELRATSGVAHMRNIADKLGSVFHKAAYFSIQHD